MLDGVATLWLLREVAVAEAHIGHGCAMGSDRKLNVSFSSDRLRDRAGFRTAIDGGRARVGWSAKNIRKVLAGAASRFEDHVVAIDPATGVAGHQATADGLAPSAALPINSDGVESVTTARRCGVWMGRGLPPFRNADHGGTTRRPRTPPPRRRLTRPVDGPACAQGSADLPESGSTSAGRPAHLFRRTTPAMRTAGARSNSRHR